MKKLITFIVILVFALNKGVAQQFPITVIPQVNSPAPVYLSSFADASTINSPLRVQLLLNDITVTNEQIRIKIHVEGNGIAFESRDIVIGADPLFINGGTPLVLTNVELAPYFELRNLQGINPNVYGAVLPEGSYQFCVEVFDFANGNRFSARTCANTYVFRNEPPLLNLPLNGINIEPRAVENIIFQWTPRHINVSNVEYELRIVEIWDDAVDPQTAFLTSVPVFETTTRATSFVYGPSEPLLLPGKRYAWRIRAKALLGAEEIGLFRNQGNSEVFWFSRSEPCKAPLGVYAEAKGKHKINVFWDEDRTLYTKYDIAYREANNASAEWFKLQTNSSWATLWHLKPNTTYEYKVNGICKYGTSQFSQIKEVTTAAEEDKTADYNCGIVPEHIAISNQNPHSGLKIGDRITAGDFVVTLTKIDSQNNGILTGKGFVKVPYLKYARLSVDFNNILVNTDKQLARGEIVTVYDENFAQGATFTQDVTFRPIEIITGDNGEVAAATVDYTIASIEKDENGAWEITGTNGEQGIIPGGEDVVITDANGDTYSVSEDGTVTEGTAAPGGPVAPQQTNGLTNNGVSEVANENIHIEFIPSGKYGFDKLEQLESGTLHEHYPLVTSGDKEIPVLFKAVSKINGDDSITAKVDFKNSNYTQEDIVFKTTKGVQIPATWNASGDEVSLALKHTFNYAIEDVVAVVSDVEDPNTSSIIGTFKLVHLGTDLSDIELVIVPLNNARVESGLERQINEIYNKAGVNFNSRIAPNFQVSQQVWDTNNNTVLDIGDSGVFSYYTNEQSAVINHYKANASYKENAYYVFISDIPVSNALTDGFMPLKQQFGFIFSTANQGRVTAHELGHGIFGLEHPFDTYGTTEGATSSLMDYGSGTTFNHMDWKKMHAPGFELYLFQSDEDGAYAHKKDAEASMKTFLTYIEGQYGGKTESIDWNKLAYLGNQGRNKIYLNRFKSHNLTYKGQKLLFEVDKYPNKTITALTIQPQAATLNIEARLGNVYYKLNLKTNGEDVVFEFDHHDHLEAFCNSLKIGRTEAYTASNQSAYSQEIIQYLTANYFVDPSLKGAQSKLNTFWAEIPKDYMSKTTEEDVWNARLSRLLTYIKEQYKGGTKTLKWNSLLKNILREDTDSKLYVSLEKMHKVNYEGVKLSFEITAQPNRDLEELTIKAESIALDIQPSLTNVHYVLALKTDAEDLEFKFDHHDDLEAFCNVLGIGRAQPYTASNESDYSKEIINFLTTEYFSKPILPVYADSFDLYFSEIPKDHLAKESEENLWKAIKAILYRPVDDKGVSEEEVVIKLIEVLGAKDPTAFLDGILEQKAYNGELLFKMLYKKIDNWGGADNFTKLMNTLYTIWSKSNRNTGAVVDEIPYTLDKDFGFYSSKSNIVFSDDYTKIDVYTKEISSKKQKRAQGGGKAGRTIKVEKEIHHGTYSIYDPITLVDYEKIKDVAGGLKAPTVNIPMFILKAIEENKSTHNIDRGANLAFDGVLTVSGVGNLAKLRYLRALSALKTKEAIEGITISLEVVNYLLEFSGECKEATAYCKTLKEYLTLVEATLSVGAAHSFLLQRKATELLEEMEKHPEVWVNSPKGLIVMENLRVIANRSDTVDVLDDLRQLDEAGKLVTVKLKIKDVELILSSTSYLLKYGICAENNASKDNANAQAEAPEQTLCKDIQTYLGYIQKGIKAKNILDKGGEKIKDVADRLYYRFSGNDAATSRLTNINNERANVSSDLSNLRNAISAQRTLPPKLREDYEKYPKVRELFDSASPTERTQLRAVWDMLENTPNLRTGGPNNVNGGNLEVLASVSYRFEYKGDYGVTGLKKLLTEGGKVNRAQRYIDNLKKADEVFAGLPIHLSGNKKGDVTVKLRHSQEEIARYKGDVFVVKKTIENAESLGFTVVKSLADYDIVRKGDEIGFKVKAE